MVETYDYRDFSYLDFVSYAISIQSEFRELIFTNKELKEGFDEKKCSVKINNKNVMQYIPSTLAGKSFFKDYFEEVEVLSINLDIQVKYSLDSLENKEGLVLTLSFFN